MTGAELAGLSNGLLYSAMAVYAVAMVCYAAELAFSSGPRRAGGRVLDEAIAAHLVTAGSAGPSPTYAEDHPAATVTAPGGGGETAGRVAVSLTVLAFLLHLGSVLARGLAAERVPWGNMFEFSVTAALAVTGVFLAMLTRRDVRYLGTFVVLPVLLTLGLAVAVLYTEAAQLVPALKSVWLVIHVAAAIVATAIFTIAFAQTICFLVQERRERVPAADRAPSLLDRFPTAAALDRASYRTHAFGYPVWIFAVVAGAIWAENAWSRYWGWDPKEVWAFITFLVYTAYLHARATAGWRGRKAAYVALAGYATILFNYFVVNLFVDGFHSYSGL